jgi:hypothetical protein
VSTEVDSWLGCGYDGVMAAKDPNPHVGRVHKGSQTMPEWCDRRQILESLIVIRHFLVKLHGFSLTMHNCQHVILTTLC